MQKYINAQQTTDIMDYHNITALGKLFTHIHVPLSPSWINLVPVQAGKVTVGLALHWPFVTDNSGITTYGK